LLLVVLAGPALAAPTSASPERKADDVGSLSGVLHAIAERSPEVLAAQASERQTRAQVEQARAAWFGKVDAKVLSQHFNDPRLTRPITQPPNVANYPFSEDQFSYGVNIELPIDLSRQIAATVDAARSRATGAHWKAEDVRLRSLLQGATLYRNLESVAGQQTALEKQLDSLKAGARAAQAGLKAGEIAHVNLLRVQAALAEVEASIAKVRGQDRMLRAQLAALMGVSEFRSPVTHSIDAPAKLPDDPQTLQPSLRAAESAFESSQSRLQAARRARYPQFFVNGGWYRNSIQWNSRPEDTWQLILGMRVPLWSGGALGSSVDVARAAVNEAKHKLSSARDNLRAAREGAVATWEAQSQAYLAVLSGLRAAEESARIEQDRFRTGLGSATDLIDAEAALARARSSGVAALAGWWQADDALRYAFGLPPLAFSDTSPLDQERSGNDTQGTPTS